MNVEFNLLMNLSWWSAYALWQGIKYHFPLTKRTQMFRPQNGCPSQLLRLKQWFSAFPMLPLCSTVPNVVVTSPPP